MGIFSSARNAISRSFDLVTETADTAAKAVHSANHLVSEHSKANDKIITTSAQKRVAEFNRDLKQELDADADLKKLMEAVIKDW